MIKSNFLRTVRYFNLVGLIVLLVSCGDNAKDKDSEPTDNMENTVSITYEQFQNGSLEHGMMSSHDFANKVSVSGVIDAPPSSKAVISAIAGGFVKEINMIVGDSVRKGQSIVTIENPEFVRMQQQYLKAYELNTYLKNEYERQKQLFAEKVTSEKKFLKAESDFKTNLALMKGHEKQLQLLRISLENVRNGRFGSSATIVAPTHGHVVEISAIPGMHVAPTDEIMEIVNTDHLHIELKVYEKDLLTIKKGQRISFKGPEASDLAFEGEVQLVGTLVNEQSRTAVVHGHFLDETKASFAVGMFVSAEIYTDSKAAMSLPEPALLELDEDWYALMLVSDSDETFEYKKVKIERGEVDKGMVAVVNSGDFDKDSEFLTKGVFSLMLE